MSSHFSLDPESFQNLLADAYVVQESGIDTRSLSAVMELQGLMADSGLGLDSAMPLIAERARNVAQATGVAIAQLHGDQLVYRAGSGSAAANVGRRVTAILSVSSHIQSKTEILRVENAQRDGRIEAAICRQFGAESLLILPVYDNRKLVGVLEIIFSDAHAFHEQEVRTYRVMASLLGEAISRAAQKAQAVKVQAAEAPASPARLAEQRRAPKIDPPVPHNPPPIQSGFSILGLTSESVSLSRGSLESFRNAVNRLAANPTFHQAYHRAATYISTIRLPEISSIRLHRFSRLKLPHFSRPKLADFSRLKLSDRWRWPDRRRFDEALSLLTSQAARMPYYKRWVVAGVLLLATWVAFRSHRPGAVAPSSTVAAESVSTQPVPASAPAAPSEPAKTSPALAPAAVVVSRPHWVRVGSNELDYVGDDVTVRYFDVKPAPRHAPAQSHVKKIGSDVTVRYFSPIGASSQVPIPGTRIHFISGESTTPKVATTPTASQAVE